MDFTHYVYHIYNLQHITADVSFYYTVKITTWTNNCIYTWHTHWYHPHILCSQIFCESINIPTPDTRGILSKAVFPPCTWSNCGSGRSIPVFQHLRKPHWTHSTGAWYDAGKGEQFNLSQLRWIYRRCRGCSLFWGHLVTRGWLLLATFPKKVLPWSSPTQLCCSATQRKPEKMTNNLYWCHTTPEYAAILYFPLINLLDIF